VVLTAGLAVPVSALASGTVTITAIQGPTPNSPTVPVAVEGQPASPAINATFTDTNAVSPSALTVQINWGDGRTSSNQSGPTFDSNLIVTEVGGPGGTTYTVSDTHTFPEEGGTTITLGVTENGHSANTDSAQTSSTVNDAPLSVASSPPIHFTGSGASAANAMVAFQSAIGGIDNGTTAGEQVGGFRQISWDDVKLDGTDSGSAVITPGHVVAVPFNRMSGRGVTFGAPLAVANDSFASVNPHAAGLFHAFSAPNIAAPFNGNQLSLKVVNPGSVPTQPQASRGLGFVFLNVRQLGFTTITYLNGSAVLDTVDVPASGSAGRPVFAGDLFSKPVVTDVVITLGGASIFSFDGTTATSGPADGVSTNLVALDDAILAEPAPLDANISTVAGSRLSGPVAHFTDTDPNGNARDYQADIDWGDGTRSTGTIAADSTGGFTVAGSHTFARSGLYRVVVTVLDFGGERHSSHFLAQVSAIVRPHNTRIVQAKISKHKHTATFKFSSTGATGFRCALVRQHNGRHNKKAKPHFSACTSTKTYRHLKKGRYKFEVEGVNSAGTAKPASKSFKI
jgi:hypothetical protein